MADDFAHALRCVRVRACVPVLPILYYISAYCAGDDARAERLDDGRRRSARVDNDKGDVRTESVCVCVCAPKVLTRVSRYAQAFIIASIRARPAGF